MLQNFWFGYYEICTFNFHLLSADYEDLRALDEDITPVAPSTSEGDNNARYMVQSHVYTQVSAVFLFYT